MVHPGDYGFQVIKSWDQGSVIDIRAVQDRTRQPDRQAGRLPQVPPDRVPVRVRTDWPDDLTREKLLLYASFAINPIERG